MLMFDIVPQNQKNREFYARFTINYGMYVHPAAFFMICGKVHPF
jgi:hypothetical protein